MCGYDLLLAAALLTNSDITVHPHHQAAWHRSVSGGLCLLALHWEILDHREVHHILAEPQDFNADLQLLRRRLEELAGSPRVADHVRFPTRDVVNSMLSLNRQYQQDLNTRLLLDSINASELRSALSEAEQLHRVWDTVRDVRCGYYYITVRRRALRDLRDLIGDAAYFSGELPPPVPMHRLPWVE